MSHRSAPRFQRLLPFFAALGLLSAIVAYGQGGKQANTVDPQFRKGALYGKVVGPDGKAIPGATVALQDKDGKILTWTTTNTMGQYALPADPMQVLSLRPSRRRGLLEACIRAAGDVAMAPVKVVGGAVANPGKALQSGAASIATGTPAPLAAQAISGMPDKETAKETARNARTLAALTALGEGPQSTANRAQGAKGVVHLLVGASTFKDGRITAKAYWMEDPTPDKVIGMQAWLETVQMQPVAGPKQTDVLPETVALSDPAVQPTLVPAGGSITIQVKLKSPPGPDHLIRVFARESRKDVVVELMPKDGNLFSGMLTLDPKTPAGETTICIAALRSLPMDVKLDPKKGDPMPLFVKRLDEMDGGKPYQYDPRIMASENRLDIKATVLPPKAGRR